ncbi:MAG: DUF456 family protein [Anaerolineales bacterium]|nr:DUF456 family protein [Anaerolineales bacterium]
MSETLLTVLTGLVMVLGFVGIFLPLFPDLLVLWGASLGYGLIVGWGEYGPWLFGAITLLAAVGVAADLWMSALGGRIGGASVASIVVGLILGIFGFIFLTPVGGIVLMLLGSFIMEYRRLGSADLALKAMLGLGVGYGAAIGIKLGIGLVILGLWIAWVMTA